MRIPNKREFLARRLRDLGLLRVLEGLARRPGLIVLCYHRIGDASADPFYGPIVSATPEAFREQIRRLRDGYRVIGLEELPRLAGHGLRVAGPTALVTFDDGYRDNLLARPILAELGVPAAFFLTTAFLDRARLPWWDHVAYAMKQSKRERFALDRPEPMAVDRPHSPIALAAVIAAFLRANRPDDPGLLAHLEERAGVDVADAGAADSLMMSWDDARDLAGAGMSIGSHTVSHPYLARLPEAEQARELIESKERIEGELGRPVEALAYPFGTAADFDATTRRLAERAGYRLAFSLRPGVNRPGQADPLAVRRLGVGPADSPVLIRARMALTGAFGASAL
jgi:peptidoglycan/xylan/chitin deacetylase (PgdA/CDA1 family)